MRPTIARAITTTLLIVAGTPVLCAQDSRPPETTREPQWTLKSGTAISLFPAGEVFPVYVADPQQPTNAILFRFVTDRKLPDTAARRFGLSAGGRFGMLRVDRATPNARAWQISIDAGLDALFDSQHSNAAIGWDGNYGVTVATASNGPWAFKVAWLHVSGHIGDEYGARVQVERREYTREEIAAAVAWRPAPRWRVYGEAGGAYETIDARQKPWRAQTGIEYETAARLLGGRFAWYAATDLSAMEERGWRIDRALQGGIVTRSGGRTYRILAEYYNGRPTVSEFFMSSETSFTIGFRIDL